MVAADLKVQRHGPGTADLKVRPTDLGRRT